MKGGICKECGGVALIAMPPRCLTCNKVMDKGGACNVCKTQPCADDVTHRGQGSIARGRSKSPLVNSAEKPKVFKTDSAEPLATIPGFPTMIPTGPTPMEAPTTDIPTPMEAPTRANADADEGKGKGKGKNVGGELWSEGKGKNPWSGDSGGGGSDGGDGETDSILAAIAKLFQ